MVHWLVRVLEHLLDLRESRDVELHEVCVQELQLLWGAIGFLWDDSDDLRPKSSIVVHVVLIREESLYLLHYFLH